jgi:predicted phosphodiesterase
MIFGFISDTHGRRALMHRVAETLTATHGVQFFYHLGDDWADAQELQYAGFSVRAVPGLWCDAYQLPHIPNARLDYVDWLTVGCAHADKDLSPRERSARLVLFGHTHEAVIRTQGESIWCNPGHLKGDHDRGFAASYGVARVEPDSLLLTIHELSGAPRLAKRFPRLHPGNTGQPGAEV